MLRKIAMVALVVYLAAVAFIAYVGYIDPPGQTGCDVTWCGMAGFLTVMAGGLPWSLLLLTASEPLHLGDVGFYWACWGCIALNVAILGALSRRKRSAAQA
jgi:hypothetical protein